MTWDYKIVQGPVDRQFNRIISEEELKQFVLPTTEPGLCRELGKKNTEGLQIRRKVMAEIYPSEDVPGGHW